MILRDPVLMVRIGGVGQALMLPIVSFSSRAGTFTLVKSALGKDLEIRPCVV